MTSQNDTKITITWKIKISKIWNLIFHSIQHSGHFSWKLDRSWVCISLIGKNPQKSLQQDSVGIYLTLMQIFKKGIKRCKIFLILTQLLAGYTRLLQQEAHNCVMRRDICQLYVMHTDHACMICMHDNLTYTSEAQRIEKPLRRTSERIAIIYFQTFTRHIIRMIQE